MYQWMETELLPRFACTLEYQAIFYVLSSDFDLVFAGALASARRQEATSPSASTGAKAGAARVQHGAKSKGEDFTLDDLIQGRRRPLLTSSRRAGCRLGDIRGSRGCGTPPRLAEGTVEE